MDAWEKRQSETAAAQAAAVSAIRFILVAGTAASEDAAVEALSAAFIATYEDGWCDGHYGAHPNPPRCSG
ncbi:TPA: hypothetical protein DEP96_02150 [Candidatus Uhrbacteria bacterium]|nr:hypothetical protein [Candidatus Uhrbacteria bacterium]